MSLQCTSNRIRNGVLVVPLPITDGTEYPLDPTIVCQYIKSKGGI